MNIALNGKTVVEVIDIVLYLAQHDLSFCGHREGWEKIKEILKVLFCY